MYVDPPLSQTSSVAHKLPPSGTDLLALQILPHSRYQLIGSIFIFFHVQQYRIYYGKRNDCTAANGPLLARLSTQFSISFSLKFNIGLNWIEFIFNSIGELGCLVELSHALQLQIFLFFFQRKLMKNVSISLKK